MGEAFDGGDLGAVGDGGEGEAAVDAAAIDEDGAGSALAVVAAFFAAGELEVFAQGVEQRGAGVEGEGLGLAVDLEGDGDGLRSGGGGVPGRLRLRQMRGMPVAAAALRMPAALTKVRREISVSVELADSVSRSSSSSGGEQGGVLMDFASRAVGRAEVVGSQGN